MELLLKEQILEDQEEKLKTLNKKYSFAISVDLIIHTKKA